MSMFVLLSALAGCARAPAPEVPAPEVLSPAAEPAPAAPVDPMAPRPFTAEQLRSAMPVGTRIRYRIEAEGRPAVEERWEVIAATGVDCTIASKTHDPESGALIADQGAATSTWADLVAHASFPVALTAIGEGTVTVPAGTFSTQRYTVHDLDGTIRVFDFAPSLPGPPVQLTATRDGAARMSMVLLERS